MPLSMFKEKQTIVAMLVAKHDEPAWGVPTLCCRLLAQDGSQLELQSTGEARQHFDQFPLHVVCSFEVARACVKAYGATSKTGIKSKAFLRMAYKPKAFQRGSMTNVCGKVVRIERAKVAVRWRGCLGDGTFVLDAWLSIVDGCSRRHRSTCVLTGCLCMPRSTQWASTFCVRTVAHSSVIPLADILEIRLRDVASTWPGLISVLPNRLGDADVFDFKPFAMRKGKRKYFAGDCVPFLEDLATCEDEDQTGLYEEDTSIHEQVRHLLEEYNLLDTKREWEAGFPKAAKIRQAFEKKIVPNLRPPRGAAVFTWSTLWGCRH
eukprot:s863_g4.t1